MEASSRGESARELSLSLTSPLVVALSGKDCASINGNEAKNTIPRELIKSCLPTLMELRNGSRLSARTSWSITARADVQEGARTKCWWRQPATLGRQERIQRARWRWVTSVDLFASLTVYSYSHRFQGLALKADRRHGPWPPPGPLVAVLDAPWTLFKPGRAFSLAGVGSRARARSNRCAH